MSGEMYQDKDYPTQWAINPATYQNMNSDQVDWAVLAQQWIKMKESTIPPTPPPPTIGDSLQSCSSNDGGGEAPMDMDTKDDDIPPAPPAPTISGSDDWNQWNQFGVQWGQAAVPPVPPAWDWVAFPAGPDGKSMGIPIPPPAPQISSNHITPAVVTSVPPLPYTYNTVPIPQAQFANQVPPTGYWNSEQHPPIPTAPIPGQPPFVKGMRHNHHRIPFAPPPPNIMPTPELIATKNRDLRDRTPEDDLSVTLDPIKRRQLPAWIREGLEKMEKEKQRAVEREKQDQLRKQELEARKKIEDEARAVLNPAKSKFDSDSEKEAIEHEEDIKDSYCNDEKPTQKEPSEQHSPDLLRPRKSRFHDASLPASLRATTSVIKEKSPDNVIPVASPTPRLSKEEMLQNLMLKVRRSLTEILLEVTNDEISSVCRDIWKRNTNKASTGKILNQTASNTAPVAQITRKLGLGIYDDSSSESEEESNLQNEPQQPPSANEYDSDEELKETLRRRQLAFRKTEAEIEARLAKEEEEEREEDDDDDDEEKDDDRSRGWEESQKEDDRREEESVRDDQSTRDKKRSRTGGVESCMRKDNYTGNTSCSETVDNDKDTIYTGNERKATSSALKSSTVDLDSSRGEVDDSSSSESACQSKPTSHAGNANTNKNSKSSSSRKKSSRYSRDHSLSSRSRSKSRNKYSSREDSYESSHSPTKPDVASNGKSKDAGGKSKKHSKNESAKRRYRSRSRSSSRSKSRSRSRSRSSSRSRSKRKRSTRSRSTTSHRSKKTSRRERSRSSRRSSRTRSRSRSYSRRKRSRSKHSRSRRSRSRSRGYRRRSSHYRRNRDGKKSSHRHQD